MLNKYLLTKGMKKVISKSGKYNGGSVLSKCRWEMKTGQEVEEVRSYRLW